MIPEKPLTSGLRPEFKRAYRRQQRGRWWQWRRWSKKANAAYHAKRMDEAFTRAALRTDLESMGYLEPVKITWHPIAPPSEGERAMLDIMERARRDVMRCHCQHCTEARDA